MTKTKFEKKNAKILNVFFSSTKEYTRTIWLPKLFFSYCIDPYDFKSVIHFKIGDLEAEDFEFWKLEILYETFEPLEGFGWNFQCRSRLINKFTRVSVFFQKVVTENRMQSWINACRTCKSHRHSHRYHFFCKCINRLASHFHCNVVFGRSKTTNLFD